MTREMRPMTIPDLRPVLIVLLPLTAVAMLTGCASMGSSSDKVPADVTGTWTYRTSGPQPLSQGTLLLATRDGRLTGRLRDEELGTIPLHADISGRRVKLRLELLQAGPFLIAAKVNNDEIRGLIDRPQYDVTMSAEASRQPGRMKGAFQAERQSSPVPTHLVLNCPKLGPDGLRPCR